MRNILAGWARPALACLLILLSGLDGAAQARPRKPLKLLPMPSPTARAELELTRIAREGGGASIDDVATDLPATPRVFAPVPSVVASAWITRPAVPVAPALPAASSPVAASAVAGPVAAIAPPPAAQPPAVAPARVETASDAPPPLTLLRLADPVDPPPDAAGGPALARDLLRRGLAAEARVALAGTPELLPLEVRALRAAAGWLERPDAAAATALRDPAIENEAEIVLWRQLAETNPAPDAAMLWAATRVFVSYPAPLQVRLGPGLLRKAIAADDLGLIRALQAELKALAAKGQIGAEVDLARAEALLRIGPARDAEALLTRLAQGRDWHTTVRARHALAAMHLHRGHWTLEMAVAELRAQRPLWHGHVDEARLLVSLGDVERRAGHQGEALDAWRSGLAVAADSTLEDGLALRLREVLDVRLDDEATAAAAALELLQLERQHPRAMAQGTGAAVIAGRRDERLAVLGLKSARPTGAMSLPPASAEEIARRAVARLGAGDVDTARASLAALGVAPALAADLVSVLSPAAEREPHAAPVSAPQLAALRRLLDGEVKPGS